MKTVIETATGKVVYSTIVEKIQLLEGQEIIYSAPTEPFIIPYWNFETGVFYEGATSEEVEEHNKPIVPSAVSRRQIKQALILAGISLANIDSAIANIPDTLERSLMQIFWEDSMEFERNHPKLIEFAQILNISEEQADGIFILASTL